MKLSRIDAQRLLPLLESASEKLVIMVHAGEEQYAPQDWAAMQEYGTWLQDLLQRLRAHMDPPRVTVN